MAVTTTRVPGTSPPAARPRTDERLTAVSLLTRLLQRPEFGALLGAIAVFVLFAFTDATNDHLWLSLTGVRDWSTVAADYGIMAVAVALLMIGGEFDLSTGVMTGSTPIVMGLIITRLHWNAWAAIVAVFAFAALIGLINGVVVVTTKLPSFIVTLATFFVLRGANVGVLLLVQGNEFVGVDPNSPPAGFDSARKVFGSHFTSTPTPGFDTSVLWWIALTVIATWVLTRTTFGNWTFAAGGDPEAARKVGVPVNRTKIILFMGTSMSAALVGIIGFTRLSQATPTQGIGLEFFYIIAAVVGGCLLTGGYGSAIGAALGACVVGMAGEGVIISHWNTDWNYTFLGVMLFLAVVVNTFIRRHALRARR
jgi:simple sugar transport system permease protein